MDVGEQPRSQGLLRFQDGGHRSHLESEVDPGNEVGWTGDFTVAWVSRPS